MAIGALVGIGASLFGASDGPRQAANAARDAWAASRDEAMNFGRVLGGRKEGALTSAFPKQKANDNEKEDKSDERDQHRRAA
jgi:hypothetical protein